ncbi:fumarylacetoacetate hydrolase family protein [Halomonas sp. M5N1S17]|uniref:2-keto-4-pentenoate hydratase n=1 Tax=Halomonas alkalisoli TaxID=2907158 RepID=UPI001F2B2DC1|nr:fumarylacetoacetate hydrolase family protein [Halomonas alkalisoli]MCE9666023.1 fumarylacetoacetate hydrolase family protein [Halomonas alkalisoli]
MSTEMLIDTAANHLLAAYPPGKLIDLPDDLPLNDVPTAYAIQARISSALGTHSGWKLGGIVKGEVPRYSRLLAEWSQASPGRFVRNDFHRVYLEPELAVVLGAAIPARKAPYTLAEIAPNVASLHAAIELVDSRFIAWPEVPPLWQLADGLSHGAFVLGSGVPAGDLTQMKNATYCMSLDDEVVLSGCGNHPGGDPAELLVAMVNDRIRRDGEGFVAGEVITTGTFDGVVEMLAGQRVHLDFAGIGEAEVRVD